MKGALGGALFVAAAMCMSAPAAQDSDALLGLINGYRACAHRCAGKPAAMSGCDWRAIGENIAAGQGSARKVMAGWLSSPGYCANIMSGDFTEMGAAHAIDRSTATIYRMQVFGSRRPPAQ